MASRVGRKRKQKVTLPGKDSRVSVSLVEVDDPYEPGKRVAVMKNTQTTPIDHIHARGRLCGDGDSHEDGLARKLAGDRFQRLYEQAESSDAKAIDYSAVKVDVSFSNRGIPEWRAAASKEMVQISQRLSKEKYAIVRAVCGEQVSFYAYVDRKSGHHWGASSRLKYYDLLRRGLDDLIEFWGVARGKERATIRVENYSGDECSLDPRR